MAPALARSGNLLISAEMVEIALEAIRRIRNQIIPRKVENSCMGVITSGRMLLRAQQTTNPSNEKLPSALHAAFARDESSREPAGNATFGSEAVPTYAASRHEASRNLHFYSLLRSTRTEFGPTDGWLFGQLPRLAAALQTPEAPVGLAQTLLSILRGHDFFRCVDRACLVRRLGRSNQMSVVDCATSDTIEDNLMPSGYRAFVAPESSLFQLEEGTYRVVADTSSVVASYRERQKPIQRSIGNVYSMGFRSGLCLPIYVGAHPAGFLFLNSRRPNAFATMRDSFTPFLVVLSAFTKSAIMANAQVSLLEDLDGHNCFGAPFRVESFRQLLTAMHCRLGGSNGFDIRDVSRREFLLVPEHLAALVTRLTLHLAFGTGIGETAPLLEIAAQPPWVAVRLEHHQRLRSEGGRNRMANLLKPSLMVAQELGFDLGWDERALAIRFPFDPVGRGDQAVKYSICPSPPASLANGI